jgi:hypothetical protein
MGISRAVKEGARRLVRQKKVVVLFYLVNVAAAAVVALPMAILLGGRLIHSLESDRLFSNFDPAFVMEMTYRYSAMPWTAIGTAGAAVAVLYVILGTFLAGGAIAVFHRDDETFFGASARYFPRLFRLLLISLLFYGVGLATGGGLAALIGRARENSMVAGPWVVLNWIRMLIVAVLFGTVNMIFDFAKIECVACGARSALRATGRAVRFAVRNPGLTFGVYWTCTLMGALLFAAYHGVTELTGQDSAAMVISVFVLRQLYVLARVWIRLWTWSSEVRVYTFSSTIVAPEPPSLAVAG